MHAKTAFYQKQKNSSGNSIACAITLHTKHYKKCFGKKGNGAPSPRSASAYSELSD